MDEFEKFLLEDRELDVETVQSLKEEKIDCPTIDNMTDHELGKYVSRMGDRIAIRQYCKRELAVQRESQGAISKAAESLMEKIKSRKRKDTGGILERSVKLSGNANAKRDERRFEIGWIDFDGQIFRQVREKRGGGTRHLKGSKDITIAEIADLAIALFFPEGRSKLGHIGDFEFSIRDLTEEVINPTTTLIQQYDLRKLKMLRLYLATQRKDTRDPPTAHSETGATAPSADHRETWTTAPSTAHRETGTTAPSTVHRETGTTAPSTAHRETGTTAPSTAHTETETTARSTAHTETWTTAPSTARTETGATAPSAFTHALQGASNQVPPDSALKTPLAAHNTAQSMDIGEAKHLPLASTSYIGEQCIGEDVMNSFVLSSDDEVELGYNLFADNGCHILDDTVPVDLTYDVEVSLNSQSAHSVMTSSPLKETRKLKLHRGHVFAELNEAVQTGMAKVSDHFIEVEMVLPNGQVEKGEDNGGVFRDALSEYWETFYRKCTTGTTIRIPVTRHDMKDTWQYIGQVMVIGFNTVGYFPIAIAKPFIDYCLGKQPQDEEVIKTFLQLIPEDERKMIEQGQQDFSAISQEEEFLDLLDAHDVKAVVKEANFQQVLLEIAHKEIIQQPAYIAKCWNGVLKNLKLASGDIDDMRSNLIPTPKKVIATLKFETTITKEQAIAGYLKKFIRNCPQDRLRRFLRFCTGADVLICSAIHVRFVDPLSDFSRSPVAHTCGCVLEMPNTYKSYFEMAEELTELFDSNVWVMDFV